MSSHSSILGGSNAARILECPASYQEQLKTPFTDASSIYAEEGTALHEAIALCVGQRVRPARLLDQIFNGVTISPEHVNVLESGLAALQALMDHYGGRWKVVGIEQTLPLPGVTGAFGSVDLILSNGTVILVVDWKFGAGVVVKALYEQGDYDVVNPQLAFYASAARGRYRRMFKDKLIVLAIIQPRLDPPLTSVETTHDELDQFEAAFRDSVVEALGRNPRMARGDHCRFATCKATCPLWTGAVLDLAAIDPVRAAVRASLAKEPTHYENYLSKSLAAIEYFETWAVEVRRQAHVYMEDGGLVPDWKLVPKRATRKWIDPEVAFTSLVAEGAVPAEILTEPELRSVAQVEKALKPRRIAIPEDLYNQVSSGTTIAHVDDARTEVTHASVAVELRQALKALG